MTLMDDPVGRGEAEPPALADVLGGEEGLEDAGAGRRIHPGSAIAHGEHHMRAGSRVDVPLHVRVVQLDIARADRELPSLRHGIPSIDGQNEDDLLELPTISRDLARRGVQVHGEVDVLAKDGLEQRLHV